MTSPADATQFPALAAAVVDEYLAADPVAATSLGDHRHDHRLAEPDAAARATQAAAWRARLADLDAVDVDALDLGEQVDHAILRHRIDSRLFALSELREHEWNPLVTNPGTAIHLLLARDFAPLPARLRAVGSRLAAIPHSLAVARTELGDMPEVHVQTAIGQFTGTRTLLATEVERALHREESVRAEVEPALEAAAAALDEHIAWLTERADDAQGDPRLGAERFARKLRLTLDTADSPDDVLAAAPPRPGQVREVLDALAAQAPDDESIVALAEQSLAETTAFVAEHDLVTIFDDPVEIVVMPEIHRGVAVAYCDPPGPLETAPLPTFYAISPTPADWPPERVASFFREYNVHMVRNLTVHEAMPGHVLQLAHDRRQRTTTRVRSTFWSGVFVEGWAVYAEELMASHGFGGEAVPMQQLKMQLRMTINAILDVRVHTRGMTREEAMRLMIEHGHQEEGEAVGKWRRALLTSTQLSTYFVGYLGVRAIVADLTAALPDAGPRQLHDAVLAHGSPPPRHLRRLLGLAPPPG